MLIAAVWLLPAALPAAAQDPLHFIDDETSVRNISFKFATTETFEESRLKAQIATQEPGFWDQVRKLLPFLAARPYPFDPVELQRDVARLRNFYRQEGFLHPVIDYRASQLDTSRNTIHVIFSVNEGPPLVIQDVDFVGPDGRTAFYQFPEDLRPGWTNLREDITVRTGDRFTSFDLIRIQDTAVRWLQNQGYAFALVDGNADVDSMENVVDLSFSVDAGPITYIDSIMVEGYESVDRNVIVRELPFKPGDRFSYSRLTQGQRELFGLNILRVAIVEVPPEQPRDSTVTIAVRVREAQPRYVSAQTGYARENGAQLQGDWTHRNFMGGARTFRAGLNLQSGFGAVPSGNVFPSRTAGGSLSLRQPYLFTRKMSGVVSPFIEYRRDDYNPNSQDFLGFGNREMGLNTTLIYEFYPFRTLTAQHSFVRVLTRSQAAEITPDAVLGQQLVRDPHNRSIFSVSGIFGKVNDFLQPSRGWLVRPFAEAGGTILGSDLDYYKLGSELVGYMELTERYGVAGRLFGGRIWPLGESKAGLLGDASFVDSVRFEQRFDPILFYAGGPTLRGWGFQLAGQKDPKRIALLPDTTRFRYVYEPRGGTSLLGGNAEFRMPFPGLGSSWSTAVFFDAALLDDQIRFSNVFADVGAGVRYQTIIGFIRVDVAYKLNPTFEDLRRPEEVFLYRYEGGPRPDERFWRRFNLQLSIGQAF